VIANQAAREASLVVLILRGARVEATRARRQARAVSVMRDRPPVALLVARRAPGGEAAVLLGEAPLEALSAGGGARSHAGLVVAGRAAPPARAAAAGVAARTRAAADTAAGLVDVLVAGVIAARLLLDVGVAEEGASLFGLRVGRRAEVAVCGEAGDRGRIGPRRGPGAGRGGW